MAGLSDQGRPKPNISQGSSESSSENDDTEFDLIADTLGSINEKLSSIDVNTRICENELHTVVRPSHDLVTVYLQISISSVDDVDTMRQEFTCQFYLAASWEEPALKHVKDDEHIEWEQNWDPRIYFQNAVDISSQTSSHKLIRPLYDGNPVVQLSYRIKGRFKSLFDLRKFPFDYQSLQIQITSKWGDSVLELKEGSYKPGTLSIKNFLCAHEWDLYKHVIGTDSCTADDCTNDHARSLLADNTSKVPHCKQRKSKGGTFYVPLPDDYKKKVQDMTDEERPLIFSVFTFSFSIRRKFSFFVSNIIVLLALISFLSLAPFCVPQSGIGDRLSIIFTLLLTAVTFKFVVSQSLPKISYQTLLDQYVLLCIIYIFGMSVVIGVTTKVPYLQKNEPITLIVCASFWLLITLTMTMKSIFAARHSASRMNHLEKKFKASNSNANIFKGIAKKKITDLILPDLSLAAPEIQVRKSESVAPFVPVVLPSLSQTIMGTSSGLITGNNSKMRRKGTMTKSLLDRRKLKIKQRRNRRPSQSVLSKALEDDGRPFLNAAMLKSDDDSEKEVVWGRYTVHFEEEAEQREKSDSEDVFPVELLMHEKQQKSLNMDDLLESDETANWCEHKENCVEKSTKRRAKKSMKELKRMERNNGHRVHANRHLGNQKG